MRLDDLRRNALRKHPFTAGDYRDHRGQRICDACGSTEDTTVHQLPESTMEQREYERRRVGD